MRLFRRNRPRKSWKWSMCRACKSPNVQVNKHGFCARCLRYSPK